MSINGLPWQKTNPRPTARPSAMRTRLMWPRLAILFVLCMPAICLGQTGVPGGTRSTATMLHQPTHILGAVDNEPSSRQPPVKIAMQTLAAPRATEVPTEPTQAEPKTDSLFTLDKIPPYPQGVQVGVLTSQQDTTDAPEPISGATFLRANPAMFRYRCGVKCPPCPQRGGPRWRAQRPIPWEIFAQGEYIGPARSAHVPVYRLRVDDLLQFVYRLSGKVSPHPYRLEVRDELRVESLSAPDTVDREVLIQPDGTITMRLLGQVPAAGLTIEELRKKLDSLYGKQIRDPQITVTPLSLNSTLQELRAAVDRRFGEGGQARNARVTPEGSIQLPGIGSVPAQGLTLGELEREVEQRYARIVDGMEVTPILFERAPRYVFVLGEVANPGRYTLEGPTTTMQAIAMAGSWNVGAQLNHIVVFRRDDNWRLMATRLRLCDALLAKQPCPPDEIWLRDSDIVLVPKSALLLADEYIEMLFTRGVYGVLPMGVHLNFAKLSTL